ncbi:MAG: SRPBCC family protein [Bowdeniella nasicola]|nr:SRPBCC family protein [Bowdeniella nasicola]
MSRFTDAAKVFHSLTISAMEEASRTGERTLGVDHLFLALVLNEQVAGQVLRSFGVTLEAARNAISEQHAEQLASLGVHVDMPASDHITFHNGAAYTWGHAALEVLERASKSGNTDDASAVLRELIQEPSGMSEALLLRLNVNPTLVMERLDQHDNCIASQCLPQDKDKLSRSAEFFVPASPQEVWDLLSKPAKMPQWLPGVERVGEVPNKVSIGAQWETTAPSKHPDGSLNKVRPELRITRVTLTEFEEPSCIAWYFTWPQAPKTNDRHIRIRIEPAAGGAQLFLSTAWVRNTTSSKHLLLPRWVRYPIYRFALWVQIQQLGSSISRAFR